MNLRPALTPPPTVDRGYSELLSRAPVKVISRDIFHISGTLEKHLMAVSSIYDEGQNALNLIIEAGFSESYQQLKQDVKLWLNQFECHTAMIIFLTENSSFRNPTNEGNSTCSVPERGLFESAMANTWSVSLLGPYCFRGHAWFRTMATATIEVLKKNPTTGRIKAKKHEVVLNGQMMVEGDSVDLNLTIGDAFPPNYVPIEDIQAEPVLLTTRL
ncbi:hypothetical protein V1527DRAFT_455781, partial [Lipomyces starkeyi]